MAEGIKEKKSIGTLKAVMIILTVVILVVVLTFALLYVVNSSFKHTVNNYFSKLPGGLGTYFESQPTEEEAKQIKTRIARQYIRYDDERLADKLLIIKGKDNNLYNDLVMLLTDENADKMNRVKERIRTLELSNNQLSRITEEIEQERLDKADSIAKYFMSLNVKDMVSEAERMYDSGELRADDFSTVMEKMSDSQRIAMFMYLKPEIIEKLRLQINEPLLNDIEKKVRQRISREEELIKIAQVYEKKLPEEAAAELGSTDKFNIEDLAIIYKNMDIKKSAQVLSLVEDNEFLLNLYQNINIIEALKKDNANTAASLAQGVQIFKNYRTRVRELADIYQKMPRQELANIAEEILKNNKIFQQHDIGLQEKIIFTEEQLLIDTLKLLNPRVKAELMGLMDTQRAVELSQKLMN